MNFKRRLVGLQEKMTEIDLDLVVYGNCQNFQYLTDLFGGGVEAVIDWRSHIDMQTSEVDNIFVPREGEPILTLSGQFSGHASEAWISDVRVLDRSLVRAGKYGESVKEVISDLDLEGNKVGIGDHVYGSTVVAIQRNVENADFYAAEALMDHLRVIKEPLEIDRLRKVGELTDRVMEMVIPKIREGVSQYELQYEVEYQGRHMGASDVSFPPTVGFVKSGSVPSPNVSNVPKDDGLVPGTCIFFDIGFVVDGYCSDFGRSFYFGPASVEVKKGYEALQQSVVETVDKMHDNSMRVCDLYPTVEQILDRLGYGDYLRARLGESRSLGHNIGIEVHEPPRLNPNYDNILRANMIMALEPKIWHSGEYYLRVEDIILVGTNKSEFLTKFDRELFQL